ncbi:hypothetical protein Ancab_015476 [Ancistrocladus abbreviatus]
MAKSGSADNFYFSGPVYLKIVDWDDEDHRRTVAASLVKGAYALEIDHLEKRRGHPALAPPWWEFFHFQLIAKLVDDNKVFGAIYKFQPELAFEWSSPGTDSTEGHPDYVIAFRGTLTKPDCLLHDLLADFHIILNQLHKTSRLGIALQAVRDTVSKGSNVWLAGHSLGAAIAMIAGKTMAMTGTFLESYLFNPPYYSVPTERIFKDQKLNQMLQVGGAVIKAAVAVALRDKCPQQRRIAESTEQIFAALARWVPNIFVHDDDFICSKYVCYFEKREAMEKLGLGATARFAAQHSYGVFLLTALGNEEHPAHLLPSARLTINMSRARDAVEAHALQHWWWHDLQLRSKNYNYQNGYK